jgi:hypothetical protein
MNDYTIFKFRKINKFTLMSIVNGELYFARPDSLNDPFDCQIDIVASFENAATMANDQTRDLLKRIQHNEYLSRLKHEISNMGVCAFSKTQENRLMWSHYADEHRGICLTYDIPKSFIDENIDQLMGITDVDYDRSLSDWFLEEVPKLSGRASFEDYAKTLLKKALTVKAKEWSYENEVRFLRRSSGTQSINKKYLVEVCFGLATPNQDIDVVSKLLHYHGYNVRLRKVVRDQSSDFGIKPVEI